MKDISRREAIARMAGGSAGLSLSLSGNALVSGEELARRGERGPRTQALTARRPRPASATAATI